VLSGVGVFLSDSIERIRTISSQFLHESVGQTLVEYALIIAFIAMALVFFLSPLLSGGVAATFGAMVTILGEAVSGLGI
jgi:Flp pilus assembly pilin Flp